jgi:hypothetical protein
MKIVLRHPSGFHIEFEGESDEFDRFEGLLTGDLSRFVRGLDAPSHDDELDDHNDSLDGEDIADDTSPNGHIDPRALMARMTKVGATTDIDRVTVIAQAAVDAGLDGVNSELADALYTELGIPKPSRWSKAFSNAKTRGLVRSAKYGYWRPTVNGENFAKHGLKPSGKRQRPTRRPADSGSDSPRLALESGSEEE